MNAPLPKEASPGSPQYESVFVRSAAPWLEASRNGSAALTQVGVDTLIAGAARPRPGALALVDHHDDAHHKLSFADLYQRVATCLARLRNFELAAGERVLICAAPGAQSFIVLAAALGAGLKPVLAPLPLPATRQAITLAARDLQPAAIFAPAQFCGVDFEEALLTLAAETSSIRFIGSLAGALDGAADFTGATLDVAGSPRARIADGWPAQETPAQIGALDNVGAAAFRSQSVLMAAALDLVRATRRASPDARNAPFLSLAAPSTFGALIAGPLASLIACAPLHQLAPFDAARFIEALGALGPVRLVTPSAILPDLIRAGVLADGSVLAVTALAHEHSARTQIDTAGLCPIVELRMTARGCEMLAL